MKPQLVYQKVRDSFDIFVVLLNANRNLGAGKQLTREMDKLVKKLHGAEVQGHVYYGTRESWDGEKLLVARNVKSNDNRKLESELKRLGFKEKRLNQVASTRVAAKPLNFERRLKQRLRAEPKKERHPMPPPTIRHKDERDEKRSRVKEDLRRNYEAASGLVKLAKDVLSGGISMNKWLDYIIIVGPYSQMSHITHELKKMNFYYNPNSREWSIKESKLSQEDKDKLRELIGHRAVLTVPTARPSTPSKPSGGTASDKQIAFIKSLLYRVGKIRDFDSISVSPAKIVSDIRKKLSDGMTSKEASETIQTLKAMIEDEM